MKKVLVVISILVGIFVLGSLDSQRVFAGCSCGPCPGGSGTPDCSQIPNSSCINDNQTAHCTPDPPPANPGGADGRDCNPGEWGACGCGGNPNDMYYCTDGGSWACQYNPGDCSPAAPPPANPPPAAPPVAPPVVPPIVPPACPKKAQGDANCDGTVNLLDYFYYVTVASGGRVPSSVNPDFNGNGTVNAEDRVIIIRTLKP